MGKDSCPGNEAQRSARSMTRTQAKADARSTNAVNGASSKAKARIRNGSTAIGSRDKATRRIERLLKAEKWKEAQPLLHRELIYTPSDHWVWMMLSETYYEQYDYEIGLECARRAIELMPDC